MVASSINLNRLAAFAAVVDSGSFTAAAEKLGLTKAMVSQHVSRLEAELGLSLLVRTTRKVTPTEVGVAFHADCARVLRDLEEAVARVGGGTGVPSGTLRLTASEDYGAAVVVPAIAAFVEKFPSVKVDFVATDEVVDLVAGNYDLAVRAGWLRSSNLRATQLGGFEELAVATPAYLRRHGTPRRPEDLAEHKWIAFTRLRSPLTWTFASRNGSTRTVRVNSSIGTNSSSSVRAFMREGAGIATLPDFMIEADIRAGKVVRLLPAWSLPKGGIHAVYPNVRYTSAKVRAFVDFLRERIAGKR
jgi:DNA-binding transcriptional LysR family regulator